MKVLSFPENFVAVDGYIGRNIAKLTTCCLMQKNNIHRIKFLVLKGIRKVVDFGELLFHDVHLKYFVYINLEMSLSICTAINYNCFKKFDILHPTPDS